MLGFFRPLLSPDKIDSFSMVCSRSKIDSVEILDVGLCRMAVDELIVIRDYESDEAILDWRLFLDSVEVAKTIGHLMRGFNLRLYENVIILLLLLKIMTTNRLGGCGKGLLWGCDSCNGDTKEAIE